MDLDWGHIVVDGMWVGSRTLEELLGSTRAQELLVIPKEIVLIVSSHLDDLILFCHLVRLWSLNAKP
jgi:hypothetical protein